MNREQLIRKIIENHKVLIEAGKAHKPLSSEGFMGASNEKLQQVLEIQEEHLKKISGRLAKVSQ